MADTKYKYSLGVQSRGGGYNTVVKEMTEKQFDAYYDKVVAEGGKIVGVFKDSVVPEGWIQTDGSDNTLQYAKKLSNTSWKYREWVDAPTDPKHDTTYKVNNWDSHKWREDVIDLKDYTEDQIWDALSVYGYVAHDLNKEALYFTQGGDEYKGDDATQLACECLFELNL